MILSELQGMSGQLAHMLVPEPRTLNPPILAQCVQTWMGH